MALAKKIKAKTTIAPTKHSAPPPTKPFIGSSFWYEVVLATFFYDQNKSIPADNTDRAADIDGFVAFCRPHFATHQHTSFLFDFCSCFSDHSHQAFEIM